MPPASLCSSGLICSAPCEWRKRRNARVVRREIRGREKRGGKGGAAGWVGAAHHGSGSVHVVFLEHRGDKLAVLPAQRLPSALLAASHALSGRGALPPVAVPNPVWLDILLHDDRHGTRSREISTLGDARFAERGNPVCDTRVDVREGITGGGVRRQVSVIIRLVRRACACASPRDASEISQRHIPPPLPKKLHWRAVCLGPALRFPPGNPRAAEPRAQLDPPAPTRLPSDHRSADRDVRPLRFQGAFASATRRTRARVFRSSSPRRGREGCPRSVADAPLSDPHPTITPASPPASSPQSFLVTLLLFICTCTYVKMKAPQLMDPYRTGLRGLFWKAARIGERLSPWVSVSCLAFGAHTFWTGGK